MPQTRWRAILAARRDGRPARLPEPSHARYVPPRGSDLDQDRLFAEPPRERIVPTGERHLLPWVSMADALGWGLTRQPATTILSGVNRSTSEMPNGVSRAETKAMIDRGDFRPAGWYVRTERKRGSDRAWIERDGDAPAPTLTTSMDGWTLRQADRANGTVRDVDEPAPTSAVLPYDEPVLAAS